MASNRLTTMKQRILRLGVTVVSIAVLAAGCTQAEDRASTETEATTSITSTAPTSQVATSLPPPTASVSTTTSTSLAPTTSLASSEDTPSEAAARLIDNELDKCVDLYEFKCAQAMEYACLNFPTGEICETAKMLHYWELKSILLAKYGEDYYKRYAGFRGFRDELSWSTLQYIFNYIDISIRFRGYLDVSPDKVASISFEEYSQNTSDGSNLPDYARAKLLRLLYTLMNYLMSELYSTTTPDEHTSNNILSLQSLPVLDTQCRAEFPFSLNELSNFESGTTEYVYQCAKDLCSTKLEANDFNCYNFEINDTSLKSTTTSLFWKLIKNLCAKSETDSLSLPFYEDSCHRIALYICKNMRGMKYSNLIAVSLEEVSCRLPARLFRRDFELAIVSCYDQIKTLLTTLNLFSKIDDSCSTATEECQKFSQSNFQQYFNRHSCPAYEESLLSEIFWKNIPTICSRDNLSLKFNDSECYKSIESFCGDTINPGPSESEIYNDTPIRDVVEIRTTLCSRVENNIWAPLRTLNINLSNPSAQLSHKFEISLFDRSFAYNIIEFELANTRLSSSNTAKILSATVICRSNYRITSECITELWKSCFDLESSKSVHESLLSEVTDAGEYICIIAWIAELANLAVILSSQFPDHYQAGNFDVFLEYITHISINGYGIHAEGLYGKYSDSGVNDVHPGYFMFPSKPIFTIDEEGVLRPIVDQEKWNPEVAESIKAFATSLAQLIQPFVRLPTEAQQGNA